MSMGKVQDGLPVKLQAVLLRCPGHCGCTHSSHTGALLNTAKDDPCPAAVVSLLNTSERETWAAKRKRLRENGD